MDTKLPTIMTPGKVNWDVITSGTIGGSTKINTSDNIISSSLIRNSTAFANTGTSINWNNGELQTTTASCGAFTFSNMKDGVSYTLVVLETTAGTCNFSPTGLTFRFVPANRPTIGRSRTVYTFLRAGNDDYVRWITGFN